MQNQKESNSLPKADSKSANLPPIPRATLELELSRLETLHQKGIVEYQQAQATVQSLQSDLLRIQGAMSTIKVFLSNSDGLPACPDQSGLN